MFLKSKRLLSLVCVTGMIAGLMSGCSFTSEKVTAERLLESAFSEKKASGIDMDMAMIFDGQMDMTELGVDGQMDLSMDMDANMKANQEYGYMSGTIKVKMLGMSVNQDVETYFDYEDGKTYTYDSESDQWSCKDSEKSDSKSLFSGLDVGELKDPVLQEHKKGEDYVVTASVGYDGLENIMGDGIGTTGDFADMADFSDMSLAVEICFSEDDKSLKSLSLQAEEGSYGDMDLNELSLKISINEMSDDIEVEIPKDVLKNAIDDVAEPYYNDMIGGSDAAIGDDSGSLSSDVMIDEPEQILESDTNDNSYPAQDNRMDEAEVTDCSVSGIGSYNGTAITQGMPADVFLSDGWENDFDEPMMFVSFDNPKYEEASMYLYSTKSSIRLDDLKANGVYGYDFDVTYCKAGGQLPRFGIKDLTWGASKEDIIAVFGEPKSMYNGDVGSTIECTLNYELSDGTELSFRISGGYDGTCVKGLSRVSAVNYSMID